MEEKRLFFRLTDRIICTYKYKILKREKKGEAIILELSSGGLMMVCREFLKAGKTLEIDIGPPLGPFKVEAEIVGCKLEWYVTDRKKDMFFTTRATFKNLSSSKRTQIINYIYKCKAERRKARLKRLGLQ